MATGDSPTVEEEMMTTDMETETVDCLYCNADVIEPDEVPATSDDDGWAAAAVGHHETCEWVVTRAHRVFEDENDRVLNEAHRAIPRPSAEEVAS